MAIKQLSSLGGEFTLDAPASASNRTITLPDSTGTLLDTASAQTITGVKGFTNGITIGGNETLSTYDEGVWTPTFSLATAGTSSFTYSTQSGTYTRIGRMIICSFALVTTAASAGTGTGALRVSGFPFSSGGSNGAAASIGYAIGFTTVSPTSGLITSTHLALNGVDINGTTNISQAHIGATMNLYGSVVYWI